jgi:hypothetical protein
VIHGRNKQHASLRCFVFVDFSFRGGEFVLSLTGVTIPLLSLVSFVRDGGLLLHEKPLRWNITFVAKGVDLLGNTSRYLYTLRAQEYQ